MAAKSLVIKILSAGVSYIFIIGLARMMSSEDFGVVATLLSSGLFFSVVGCFGQRMALLRFVPNLIESGNSKLLVNEAFSIAIKGNLIVYFLLVLLVYFFSGFLEIGSTPNYILMSGLLIVPLTAILDMQSHLARAHGSVIIAVSPKDLIWRLLTLVVVFLMFWYNNFIEVGLWGVILLLCFNLLILTAGQYLALSRKIGYVWKFDFTQFRKSNITHIELKRTAFSFWIFSISVMCFSNLDVVAAGFIIGPESAASYFAANRIALVPSLIYVSYNVIVGPIFSKLFSEGKNLEINRLASKTTLLVFFPTLLCVVILYIFSVPILGLFGADYESACVTLRILLLASLIQAALGGADLILAMCGQEKLMMKLSLFNITIGIIFIVVGSSLGSQDTLALAILLGVLTSRVVSLIALRRTLGIYIDVFSITTKIFQNKLRS